MHEFSLDRSGAILGSLNGELQVVHPFRAREVYDGSPHQADYPYWIRSGLKARLEAMVADDDV